MSGPPTSAQRVFLGWQQPALVSAAQWLVDQASDGESCDLSQMILVTPGRRAGRRLLDLLIEAAEPRPLLPPRFATLGRLPDLLYRPTAPIASRLQSALAWAAALKRLPEADRDALFPHPPAGDDWLGWFQLVREIIRLHETVCVDAATFEQVAQVEGIEVERWQTLAQLETFYRELLDEQQLTDRQHARRDAACHSDHPIVLVGCADLGKQAAQMLTQVSDRVTSLIFAPEAHAGGFDALGGLMTGYWQQRRLRVPDEKLRVVDRPEDQAMEAAAVLAEHAQADPALPADRVTVGLADAALGAMTQRTLSMAGVPTHRPVGEAVTDAAPAVLLEHIARFVTRQRLSDFAALLRHPDAEAHVLRDPAASAQAVRDWLTLLDEYATDHLQARITGHWLGKQREALAYVYQRIEALLPEAPQHDRPLCEWAGPIAEMLTRVYDPLELSRGKRAHEPIILSLEAIAEVLRELAALAPDAPTTPSVPMSQAIYLLLSQLHGQSLEPESAGVAVELLGWLELPLDDAPVLVVTGFNEGAVPESITAQAFLPDQMRRALGLTDNRKRLARDRLLLETLLESRPHTTLIAGRRGWQDDPLTPSRLLLMDQPEALPARVSQLTKPAPDARPRQLLRSHPHGEMDLRIAPPEPDPQAVAELLARMPVTAFGRYQRCPYRFYLERFEKLKARDDRATELDGASFGSLMHNVLQNFGQSELKNDPDAERVFAFLEHELGRQLTERCGNQPSVVVQLQQDQMRQRLRAFSYWQAEQVRQGWEILSQHIEADFHAPLIGEQVRVRGRIDRIDVNTKEQTLRIIDYKTGDQRKKPDQVHRKSERWVDFQLPLYRLLVEHAGLTGRIVPGYVCLPKKPGDLGFYAARWQARDDSAHQQALDAARDIAQRIAEGVFWPPNILSEPYDDHAPVCFEHVQDQRELIQRSALAAAVDRPQPAAGGAR